VKRYYTIDFTATTSGSVRVKAKNKQDAFKRANFGDTNDQVEDVLNNTKMYEMEIVFDRRSVDLDTDQDVGPGQEDDEEDE